MSAERLREAAALMRSRAEDCADGWDVKHTPQSWHETYWVDGDYDQDAPHIASWHPAVAVGVADWLDDAASSADACEMSMLTTPPINIRVYMVDSHISSALAVANAYLGGAA